MGRKMPPDWQNQIYQVLRRHEVTQFAYVPDARHATLIDLSLEDDEVQSIALTTEEEGAVLAEWRQLAGKQTLEGHH